MINHKILVAMTVGPILMSSSFFAAANSGSGKVTFIGELIDAPCSIVPDSLDSTVPMGQISIKEVENGGESSPRPFTIKLENCDFGTPAATNKVQVTFSGVKDSVDSGLLGIVGTAQNAGIKLTSPGGTSVTLGDPLPPQDLIIGNNELTFAATLKGNSATSVAVPGDFTAMTNFILTYQ